MKGPDHLFWKGTPKYRDNKYHSKHIVEICLGYKPPKGSTIHHMDENPRNNEPSNLRLFPHHRDHSRYHIQLLDSQRRGIPVDTNQLALENGALEIPPLPSGFELTPDKERLQWP